MSNSKQMMDIQKYQSVEKALSNENQRRWSEDLFKRKVEDPRTNYDPTRTHLNFEIVRGGKVQPVDKSKDIQKKIDGIISRKVMGRVNSVSIRCVSIMYGGNRERMRELAFGNQPINEDGKNNNLQRHTDIERWAQDVYHYTCDEFGEDNIASFIVHLDEINPHVHCMVVPVTKDGRLSAKELFGGKDKNAAKQRMKQLHDHLASVNEKWGLLRGDSIDETGVKHRSLEQYRRDLVHENKELKNEISKSWDTLEQLNAEIQKAERAVKGLTTMIHNLEQKRNLAERELQDLTTQLESGKGNVEELAKTIREKKSIFDFYESLVENKQEKLKEANARLSTLNSELEKASAQKSQVERQTQKLVFDYRRMEQNFDTSVENLHHHITRVLSESALNTIVEEYSRIKGKLSYSDSNLFDDTMLNDIAERSGEIFKCAMMLYVNSLSAANAYAQTQGGGGCSNNSNWGRDKDEDDWKFALRCLRQASMMLKPRKSRGWHR